MKCLSALLLLTIVACFDLDAFWQPDPTLPPDSLPLRIDDHSYDSQVVDPSTGRTFDPVKPWFIFFFYRKCKISQ